MEAFSFTHLRALCCIDICGDELFMLSGLHPFDSVIYVTDSRGEIRGEVRSNRAACLVGRMEEAYEILPLFCEFVERMKRWINALPIFVSFFMS